jgi:hypothetical protein
MIKNLIFVKIIAAISIIEEFRNATQQLKIERNARYIIIYVECGESASTPAASTRSQFNKIQNDASNSFKNIAVEWYLNTTDQHLNMDLFFPFSNPVDTSIENLSIYLIRHQSNQETTVIPVSWQIDAPDKVSFDFIIHPKEKVDLRVFYQESIIENKAEYIITSIRKWKQPVEKAIFTVELPANIQSPYFSFQNGLVEKINQGGADCYTFELRNLFPEREFEIARRR